MRVFTPQSRTLLTPIVLAAFFASPTGAQELVWTSEQIGTGIKPAISLDNNDVPHLAFITEAISGATFYATNASGQWVSEEIAKGYFYGPVDIDVAADGVPYVAYHDHQAAQFDPSLGAGVVVDKSNGQWQLTTISDDGHDQWDSDIAAEPGGIWHFAGIDPIQFGSQVGLEYITNAFGDVTVEEVGSGAIPYEFGASIELDGKGGVGISYFNAPDESLCYAERGAGPGGTWSITTVAADGDTGRYSDLAYDADGNPHVSYWVAQSATGGAVRHAWRDGGEWQTDDVGILSDIQPGFTGARKITAIELDTAGTPHIMYGDKSQIMYAVRAEDGAWRSQEAMNSDGRFGQLVEFALGTDGRPHMTYFEVTNPSPLEGTIFYATAN